MESFTYIADDLPLDEAHTRTICLNEVCKVCLKDLTDSPHKIPFFDDFGQCSTEISKISAALELMNVEVGGSAPIVQSFFFHITRPIVSDSKGLQYPQTDVHGMFQHFVEDDAVPTDL